MASGTGRSHAGLVARMLPEGSLGCTENRCADNLGICQARE